jgi:hypothetical protein
MNKITAGILAAGVAVLLAASGCDKTPKPTDPNPTPVMTTPTTAVAAPSTSAPTTQPGLQPGPHSWVADIDLPEATDPCTTMLCETDLTGGIYPKQEYWRYSAPYDDTVAFLRDRFATGRRYDAHGATWWKGLPPCYNPAHESPPWGSTYTNPKRGGARQTRWMWADDASGLLVLVFEPYGSTPGVIFISADINLKGVAQSSECLRA